MISLTELMKKSNNLYMYVHKVPVSKYFQLHRRTVIISKLDYHINMSRKFYVKKSTVSTYISITY